MALGRVDGAQLVRVVVSAFASVLGVEEVVSMIAQLVWVVVSAFAVFWAVWEWQSVLQQLRQSGYGSGGALGGGLSVTGFFGNPRIQFDPGGTPASK